MQIPKFTIIIILLVILLGGGLNIYFNAIDSHDNELPKGFADLNKVELLKINQSVTQVYELLGEPHEESGSGYHYCIYKIEDQNYEKLRLVFKGYLEEAYLIDKTGVQTLVNLETLPEEEIENLEIEIPEGS